MSRTNKLKNIHQPVLVAEIENIVRQNLKPGKYADLTFGGGGHTRAILGILKDSKVNFEYEVVDLDQEVSGLIPTEVKFSNTNFTEFLESAISLKEKYVFLLADLGLSLNQLKHRSIGFSFRETSRLDMRLDKNLQVTAADLLNGLGRNQLKLLLRDICEVDGYKLLLEDIVKFRRTAPIKTTSDLNKLIEKNFDLKIVAPKIYQGLRIAVNLEYQNLKTLLRKAPEVLEPEGLLVIITFHSGEEKIVTSEIKIQSELALEAILTPKRQEVMQNSSSRSAKLYLIRRK